MNPYHILGLRATCSLDQVRAAFRRLSKTAHPDAGGTTEGFAQLSWAHELLTDTTRREWFDEHGWDCGPEKDRQSMATSILQVHLRQLLSSDEGEPTQEDLVRTLTNHLDKEIAESRKIMVKLDRAERRIAELQRRFVQRRVDTNSVIHSILENEVREIANARRQAHQQEAARVELKRMVSSYTFTHDRPQMYQRVSQQAYVQFGTGTTTYGRTR